MALSTAQVLDDQRVRRIPPLPETTSPLESTGSREPLTGPVHDRFDHPNRRQHDANMLPPSQKRIENSNKNTNKRPRLHERIQHNDLFQQIFSTPNYTRFFTISHIDPEDNLSKINVIKANRELIRTLNGSKPKKVEETRNGSLTVEVASEEQSQLIRNLSKLDDTPITVSEHSFLNQVKGTIYYRNRCNYSEAEILEELSPYKVTQVYRTKRKVANELLPNNIYILTFNATKIPDDVEIGWNRCRVKEYIPNARRCFKCQGFQHNSKNCRSELSICVNCGQESHGLNCDRTPCCRNCNEEHAASSKECFYYKLANEIIILQTREKISYRDARYKAVQNMSKNDKMYSTVVKRQPPSISSTHRSNNRTDSFHSPTPGPSSARHEKQENTQTQSKRAEKTPNQIRNPKPSTISDKKRPTPDSDSNSDDKPIKHPKSGTSTTVLPVSTNSQETPCESEMQQRNIPSPVPARKAAVTAAKKISCSEDQEDVMEHSQIIKSKPRSSSKHRKITTNQQQ